MSDDSNTETNSVHVERRSGIGPVSNPAMEDHSVRIAGEVDLPDVSSFMSRKLANRLGRFVVKKDERTKIFAVNSGTLIIYELPVWVDASKLYFEEDEDLNSYLTDGGGLKLDVTETVQGHHLASA